MIEYKPPVVKTIWIVVRLSEESAGYRPNSEQKRTRKFWRACDAEQACRDFDKKRIPYKLYSAQVSPWREISL